MKRRSFLRLGAAPIVGGALSACGGNANDLGSSPGNNPGSTPGSNPGGDPGTLPAGDPGSVPAGQPPHENTVSGWTRVALQAVRVVKPGPPMAARSFAVLYTCMYNAWCAYDPVAQPVRPSPVGRRPAAERSAANKALAISYAAYAALLDQFPTQKDAFDAHMKSLGCDVSQALAGAGGPAGLGTQVAGLEIAYCHRDGANQLGDLTPSGVPYADYTGYVPKNPPMVVALPTPRETIPDPSHWQPLTYADAAGVVRTPIFLGAAWEKVKPFALASSSQYRPGPPPVWGAPEYVEEVQRIIEVQQALSDEQKAVTEYWADITGTELPPGHWLLFGLYVSERDRHTDDQDVTMFFALSNALADAAIASWDAKRAYDSVRPITAVRYLMSGQAIVGYGLLGPAGGRSHIQGETWMPYQPKTFPTPPFPEYVSGHSTFSAAAAEVLRRFTGSDAFGASHTVAAHSTTVEPGLPSTELTLHWATFSAAAEEAGISRVYGGIHFDSGNLAGQALGRKVGAQAFARASSLWQGKT